MQRNGKLIAGAAAVALLAGGGAAFATVKLVSTHATAPTAPQPARTGVSGFGLGGRLGGRGFGGGLRTSGLRTSGLRAGETGGLARSLGPAASYLGLSNETLGADLAQGKTLAELAKARGRSVTGLVAALVAARNKALDLAVASGRLTASQEKQLEAAESERVADLVNNVQHHRARPGSTSGVTA